jgi:hypothetical protein
MTRLSHVDDGVDVSGVRQGVESRVEEKRSSTQE